MSEANVLKRIMKTLSANGSRMFRNNNGEAWIGQSKRISKKGLYYCEEGDVIVRFARRFIGGLECSSGDTVGWTPVVITPEMVGKKVAIFTNIEAKKDEKKAIAASKSNGKHEKAQQKFDSAVRRDGGISGFAGSEDQALDIVKEWHPVTT